MSRVFRFAIRKYIPEFEARKTKTIQAVPPYNALFKDFARKLPKQSIPGQGSSHMLPHRGNQLRALISKRDCRLIPWLGNQRRVSAACLNNSSRKQILFEIFGVKGCLNMVQSKCHNALSTVERVWQCWKSGKTTRQESRGQVRIAKRPDLSIPLYRYSVSFDWEVEPMQSPCVPLRDGLKNQV